MHSDIIGPVKLRCVARYCRRVRPASAIWYVCIRTGGRTKSGVGTAAFEAQVILRARPRTYIGRELQPVGSGSRATAYCMRIVYRNLEEGVGGGSRLTGTVARASRAIASSREDPLGELRASKYFDVLRRRPQLPSW